jgi:ABC-type dipeptide/oligopeptide/nickel transport system permease subunit
VGAFGSAVTVIVGALLGLIAGRRGGGVHRER